MTATAARIRSNSRSSPNSVTMPPTVLKNETRLPKRPVFFAVAGFPVADGAPMRSDAQLKRTLSSGVDPAFPEPVEPASEVWPPVVPLPVVVPPPLLAPVEPDPGPVDPLPPAPEPFEFVDVQNSVFVV